MKVKILPGAVNVRDGVSRYTTSLVTALRKQDVEIVAHGDDYDVLHLVAAHRYDPEWREAKRRGKRLVVTVHDLIPEHFNLTGPQYAGVAERREILEAADAIIAVSQYTKEDIIATYGIPAVKIHVIHNGVAQDEKDCPLSTSNLHLHLFSSGSVVALGTRTSSGLCGPLRRFLWRTNWRVACTGGQAFGRKERLLLALLGLSRRFEVVCADEAQMMQLYRAAICLVMPSMMEGFGLPLIEAMANGCPVVVPRAHVFPEIAGDAAAYYELGDAEGLRRQIATYMETSFRTTLIEKGRLQAGRYSWAQCAEEVCKVYEQTISWCR